MDFRGIPRKTVHHRHCLIITIILFVCYYTVYTFYMNYFVRYQPFFGHWSCKIQPNTRVISLCTIVWCWDTPSTRVCSGYTILQPVSCKNVLRQSPPGPCHDSAARNRPWSFCSVAGNSLVCPSIAPVLSLCSDRHWVPVLRLCTCVNDGNMRPSWKWL